MGLVDRESYVAFRHDLLMAMFDVTTPYWNLLWGGFVALGDAVFALRCALLKRKA